MNELTLDELRIKKLIEEEQKKFLKVTKSMFTIESFTSKFGSGSLLCETPSFGLTLINNGKAYSACRNLYFFKVNEEVYIHAEHLLHEIIQEIFMKIKYEKINN